MIALRSFGIAFTWVLFLFLTSWGCYLCLYWLLFWLYFLYCYLLHIIDIFLVIDILFSFFVCSDIIEFIALFQRASICSLQATLLFLTIRRFRRDPLLSFLHLCLLPFLGFRARDFLGEPANSISCLASLFLTWFLAIQLFIFVSCFFSSSLACQGPSLLLLRTVPNSPLLLKTKSTRNNRPSLPSFHI